MTITQKVKKLVPSFLIATFLMTGVAVAQSACFERAALMKHLNGKFSEHPVAAGLAANGSVLEVFSSKDGDTWTIILVHPTSTACVMASGKSWMVIKLPKGKAS